MLTRRAALAAAVCMASTGVACRRIRGSRGSRPEPGGPLEHMGKAPGSSRHHAILGRVLLERHPARACEMLVAPSFSPEYAVYLACTSDGWSVVAQEAAEQVWPAFGDGRPMSRADEDLLVLKLSRRTRTFTAALHPETTHALHGVWTEMLRRRVPQSPPSGVDGTGYYFGQAGARGHTWSPDPGTLSGRLVTLGEALILVAAAGDGATAARASRVVGDLAANLLTTLNTSPTNDLLCR